MTRVGVHGLFAMTYRNPRGVREWDAFFPNGVTYQGLDSLLDAVHRAGPRFATWYVGLIDNSGYSALDAADTHGSHPGWAEFASVLGSARPAWSPAAAIAGVVAATAAAVVQVTGSGSVRGAFLASTPTVGVSPSAVLYATGAAGSGLTVAAGGTVSISYSVRLTPR